MRNEARAINPDSLDMNRSLCLRLLLRSSTSIRLFNKGRSWRYVQRMERFSDIALLPRECDDHTLSAHAHESA
jgi:hypothetical protein